MPGILWLLIYLIIALVLGGLIYTLVMMIPMPPKIKLVVQILMLLVAIIFVASLFFGWVPLPAYHMRRY